MGAGGWRLLTFCILDPRDEVGFGKGGDTSVDAAAAAEAREGADEGGGHHFVVFAALLHLGVLLVDAGGEWGLRECVYGGEDSPVF